MDCLQLKNIQFDHHQDGINEIKSHHVTLKAFGYYKPIIGFLSLILMGLHGFYLDLDAATLVSNLSELDNGTLGINSAAYRAVSFTTGPNASGYSLDSATVKFDSANNTATSLFVSLANTDGGNPGTDIETLTGAVPTTAGDHAFTSTGTALTANTQYWLVFGSNDLLLGNVRATYTNSDSQTSSDSWLIGNVSRDSNDQGTSWSNSAFGRTMQISIEATPVPESDMYALVIGIGLIGYFIRRCSFPRNLSDSIHKFTLNEMKSQETPSSNS